MTKIKRVFLGRGYWDPENYHIRSLGANLSRWHENNIEIQLGISKHEARIECQFNKENLSVVYYKIDEDGKLEYRGEIGKMKIRK